MNTSDFPGFLGFINPIASSHPDKLRVQKDITIEVVDDNTTLQEDISNTIKKLKYIETPECRAIMDKEMIDNKRKQYTMVFKTLLQIKERQNIK